MKQTDPHFKMRIPPDLKARIEASAKANSRTMSAEILFRVAESYDREEWRETAQRMRDERMKNGPPPPPKTQEQVAEDVTHAMRRLERNLNKLIEQFGVEVAASGASKLDDAGG
jgi:hypothetical protein